MPQVWIDIEDNDNCGYFPMQTFEARAAETTASSVVIDSIDETGGETEVVGWSDAGRCDVRVVRVGDSGAGESILVHGGNHGIRLRAANVDRPWSLDDDDETGEPYLLLPVDSRVDFSA